MIWDVDFSRDIARAHDVFTLAVAFRTDSPVVVLTGPSGSGKSLALRHIAGLARPDAGRIAVGGRIFFDASRKTNLPARDRKTGLVFQEHALFPHLTVRGNIGFAESKGLFAARAGHTPRTERLLDLFGLRDVADHPPSAISGGQRQRVALARALCDPPEALLLDEPFSALDIPLKRRLRTELIALLNETGIPAIVVTHDTEDIEAFGGTLVRMRAGNTRTAEMVGPAGFEPATKGL